MMKSKISSFEELDAVANKHAPVVTLFSGGLDSSFLLLRLKRLGFSSVKAVVVDLGEPMDRVRLTKTATQLGAELVYLDGRADFVAGAVAPAIRAHAKYCGVYPVSSSLSRPVMAKFAADFACAVDAPILLHTANRSQNSLRRLNGSILHHSYEGQYGSPYEYSALTRQEKINELAAVGLTFLAGRSLSGDENLWCREFESGPLDDPENFQLPETAFVWTRAGEGMDADSIALRFEAGELVAIDGANVDLITAISSLNHRMGRFGHGRYIGLEHLAGDQKVLEVREAPAATLLMDALRHIEMATLETHALQLKLQLEQCWTDEAVSGRWYSTMRMVCETAIREMSQASSGEVTYRVDTRRFFPTRIVAEKPRYLRDRDGWEVAQADKDRADAAILVRTSMYRSTAAA